MRFSQIYTRAQFADAAVLSWFRSSDWSRSDQSDRPHAYAEACAADARDRELLEQHKTSAFGPAMKAWLEQLRTGGRLNRLSGLGGRDTVLPHAWNAFIDGDANDWQLRDLLSAFEGFLTWAIIKIDEQRYARKQALAFVPGAHIIPTDGQVDAAYAALVSAVEAGNTDFTLRFDDIRDSKTGDRLKIEISNWTATLMKRGSAADQYRYEPATDAVTIPLQSVDIDLPTGDLFLSDWIRVPGFKEATDLGYDDESLNISSELGAINTTKAHAARHGFAHVQTTNTCVIAHQAPDGRLIISQQWDSRDEHEATAGDMAKVGDFSCDLWWITAIDRQVLLGLMANGGCQTPEASLDAYLASTDPYADNIVRLKVAPGRWRLHFGPDFAQRANRAEMGIPIGPEPWLILEPLVA